MDEVFHHKNGGSYTLEQLEEEAAARAGAAKPAPADEPVKPAARSGRAVNE